MKFGHSVWFGDKSQLKALERAKRLGFDYVEFCLDYPFPYSISKGQIQQLLRTKKRLGLEFGFHAPWWGINLAHPDPYIHQASVDVIKGCIDFASAFDSIYLNTHIIMEYKQMFAEFPEVERAVMKHAFDAAKGITTYAKQKGVSVTFENDPSPWIGLPSQFKKILSVPGAHLCLDVGHLTKLMVEGADVPVEKWVNQFSRKFLLCHFHDSGFLDDEFQDHFILGAGFLDLEYIAQQLKKTSCKYATLEVFFNKHGRRVSDKEIATSLRQARTLFR